MTTSEPHRRAGSLVRAVLLSLVVLFASASPASANARQQPSNGSDNGPVTGTPSNGVIQSWALSPGDGSSETAGRPNLSYELAPGTSADDVVTVYNLSNVALTFKIYATDAFNAADGSFSLLPGNQPPSDVGTWLSLPTDGVTLAAGTQATMPVKLTVPVDARPGDHAGALLASSVATGTGPDGKIVNVDRRTGTRVYVRVAGLLQPKLAVEDLATKYTYALNPLGGGADVSYKIVNRGNVRLGGTQRLTLSGPFGLLGKSASAEDIPELLPGQSVSVTKHLDGIAASVVLATNVELRPKSVGANQSDQPTVNRKSYALAIPLVLVAAPIIFLLGFLTRRGYLRHRDEEVEIEPVREREPERV